MGPCQDSNGVASEKKWVCSRVSRRRTQSMAGINRWESSGIIFLLDSFLFSVIYFFLLTILDPPPGGIEISRNLSRIDASRFGRNPPSVPSSICLIVEPAPHAELTR